MSEKIAELRAALADESVPPSDRKAAAEHLIRLQVEAIEAAGIPDDDPEVMESTKPWSNTALASLWSPTPNAPALKGRSLPDAKSAVMKRRKLRVLLSFITDDAAHRLEKLAASEQILHHWSVRKWSMNSYTAEKLLSERLPADALKWTASAWRTGPVKVSRPPLELADVWRF